jgi:putative membrane protein
MISRTRAGIRFAAAGLLALAGTGAAAPAMATEVFTSAADERWLATAHRSNLAEIMAAEDARRFAVDEDVQDAARHLIVDHVGLDETVNDLADKYDVILPSEPSEAQRAERVALRAREGRAYDAAWVRSRIAAHRQIRAAAVQEVAEGQAPDVVAAARETAAVAQSHLDELTGVPGGRGTGAAGAPTAVTGGTGGQAAAAASGSLPRTVLTVLGIGLVGAGAWVGWRRRRAAG